VLYYWKEEFLSVTDVSELITTDWRVHGSIYREPGLFTAEMDRIFRKCWIYLAHESQLREPGAFVRTYVGTQPVVVTRGEDNSFHALLNRCRHRGSIICREESGVACRFRCPYHGWTYGIDGTLRTVTFPEGYTDLETSKLGLVPLPRVENFAGFIFGSFAADGSELSEYLGNSKSYLQIISAQGSDGIELSAGAHRISYRANWKLQVENTIDNYHFGFVHRSYLEMLSARLGAPPPIESNIAANPEWRTIDLGGGHSVHEFGDPRTGSNQGQLGDLPFNLIVFPNLCFVGAQLRLVLPKAVDRTEVLLFPMLRRGAEADTNASILRAHESFYGPAGAGTMDDIDVAFDRVQQGLQATGDDWLLLCRGFHREEPGEGGILIGHSADELPQRAFYREWLRRMEREE